MPVTLPWEDIEVAVQTGELDGIAWSGITEDYTVGWADVTNYFLTNNISGAWAGSFFANMDRYNELPDHLKELLKLTMDSSHYYRQWWYWGGEASLRTKGTKMEADLDSRRGVGAGRGRRRQVLGRDRLRVRDQGSTRCMEARLVSSCRLTKATTKNAVRISTMVGAGALSMKKLR